MLLVFYPTSCTTRQGLASQLQLQLAHPPDRLPICFCGRMICTLCALSVLGMGWLRMQTARTTRDVGRVLPAK
jgi:hypothetical protein